MVLGPLPQGSWTLQINATSWHGVQRVQVAGYDVSTSAATFAPIELSNMSADAGGLTLQLSAAEEACASHFLISDCVRSSCCFWCHDWQAHAGQCLPSVVYAGGSEEVGQVCPDPLVPVSPGLFVPVTAVPVKLGCQYSCAVDLADSVFCCLLVRKGPKRPLGRNFPFAGHEAATCWPCDRGPWLCRKLVCRMCGFVASVVASEEGESLTKPP